MDLHLDDLPWAQKPERPWVETLSPPEGVKRERIVITYHKDGAEWSVLGPHSGIAVIEADDEDGQEAFENQLGEAMVRCARYFGRAHRWPDDPEPLIAFLRDQPFASPESTQG
jgi:hypothetical protein